MGPGARPVLPGDLPCLEGLLAEALAQLPGQRGGALLAPDLLGGESLSSRLARATPDGDACLLAGTLGGSLVGLAGARIQPRPARLAALDLLYVAPRARRAGVARSLLAGVRAWALGRGCRNLDVPALPGDRALKSLLESEGLRARLLILSASLEAPSPP